MHILGSSSNDPRPVLFRVAHLQADQLHHQLSLHAGIEGLKQQVLKQGAVLAEIGSGSAGPGGLPPGALSGRADTVTCSGRATASPGDLSPEAVSSGADALTCSSSASVAVLPVAALLPAVERAEWLVAEHRTIQQYALRYNPRNCGRITGVALGMCLSVPMGKATATAARPAGPISTKTVLQCM